MAEHNKVENNDEANVYMDQLIESETHFPINNNTMSTPEQPDDHRGTSVHDFQPVDQRAVDRFQDMLEGVIRYSRDMELRFEKKYQMILEMLSAPPESDNTSAQPPKNTPGETPTSHRT